MKPSIFKKGIEKEFDYICKQVIRDEQKDYDRYLKRLSRKETSFSMIDEHHIKKMSTIDLKPSHYYTFSINGLSVQIENDLLAEALEQMTSRKREVILLYYFMELGTQQIADLLELNRSTIYRHRRDALEFIKNFMEVKKMKTYPKVSFEIIAPATDGDQEAIHQVLNHYEGYIAKLSLRPLKDEYGNQRMIVDETLRGRIQTRLITKILSFEIDYFFEKVFALFN